MKPFSSFAFVFFEIGLFIGTYLFLGQKRDPNLLRAGEVVPSEKNLRPLI